MTLDPKPRTPKQERMQRLEGDMAALQRAGVGMASQLTQREVEVAQARFEVILRSSLPFYSQSHCNSDRDDCLMSTFGVAFCMSRRSARKENIKSQSYILNPISQTPNTKPQTPNPNPQTLTPEPQTRRWGCKRHWARQERRSRPFRYNLNSDPETQTPKPKTRDSTS